MIQSRIYTTLLTVLLSLPAFAASTRPVEVSQVDYKYADGRLVVSFTLTAAPTSCKRVVVNPSLVGQGGTVSLDPAAVVGNERVRMDKQRRLIGEPVGQIARTGRSGIALAYRDTVAVAPWMHQGFTLRCELKEDGCGEVNELASQEFPSKLPQLLQAKLPTRVAPRDPLAPIVARYPFVAREGFKVDSVRGASVKFPLSNMELNADYGNNRAELEKIEAAVQAVRNEPQTELSYITIRGFASPEGSDANNQRLSDGRAAALRNYLKQSLTLTDADFNIAGNGSDWNGLRELVAKSSMSYREEVLAILDNTPAEQRTDALKQLHGGEPYKAMLLVLYPQLRDACYINVWCRVLPDEHAEIINRAIALIEQQKYEEANGLLEGISGDTRAMNPRAVALYYLGRLEESQSLLTKAAEAGDEMAAYNLELLYK
jgi:outer membrane protein OmpA-like peptidoglycan-associated protein